MSFFVFLFRFSILRIKLTFFWWCFRGPWLFWTWSDKTTCFQSPLLLFAASISSCRHFEVISFGIRCLLDGRFFGSCAWAYTLLLSTALNRASSTILSAFSSAFYSNHTDLFNLRLADDFSGPVGRPFFIVLSFFCSFASPTSFIFHLKYHYQTLNAFFKINL